MAGCWCTWVCGCVCVCAGVWVLQRVSWNSDGKTFEKGVNHCIGGGGIATIMSTGLRGGWQKDLDR